MIVKVRVTEVNGNKKTQYVFRGKVYEDLKHLLCESFETQGDFYGEVCGVSLEDSELAGWHPHDKDFSSTRCQGWEKFIFCRGVITKDVREMEVDIRDLLFNDK